MTGIRDRTIVTPKHEWIVGDSNVAVSRAASAPMAGARPGGTRIKVAVVLLAWPTVISAAFLVLAVPGLVFNPGEPAFYLNDAPIALPLVVPLVAAATALVIRATWRGWGLDSLRLLLLASVAWLAAGAYVLAAGGTASLFVISGLAVALLGSVVRDRRRPVETGVAP